VITSIGTGQFSSRHAKQPHTTGLVLSIVSSTGLTLLPYSFRLERNADKWVLKEIGLRYLPRSIVYRKKSDLIYPVADYLAPTAQEKFSRDSCVEFFAMHHRRVMEAVSAWRESVHGFFNLLAVEIRGHLRFMGKQRKR